MADSSTHQSHASNSFSPRPSSLVDSNMTTNHFTGLSRGEMEKKIEDLMRDKQELIREKSKLIAQKCALNAQILAAQKRRNGLKRSVASLTRRVAEITRDKAECEVRRQ